MKAVLFDLYETLVTENHPEWHVPSLAPGERLGIPREEFNREWAARYGARMSGRLPLYGDVLRDICRACRIHPPEEEIASMQAERAAAKARPFERLDPAVVETLRALKAEGYRIGLISNCSHDETAAWDSSELSALVEEPVFSCVEGLVKPNPAIYHLACERFGVDAGAAFFVGDGGSDELRGADAAGLKPVWATWFIEKWPWNWVGKAARTSDAFPRCRRIEDLPALLDDQARTPRSGRFSRLADPSRYGNHCRMSERMKIGFIGCGRAAQTVHLPWFAASEQCEITTLVDRRVELASELASTYGIPKVAGDHRVLCDDPGIEAVAMILREPLHAPVGIDLLRAGKHVFTEKPLSDRLPEARRLANVATETGRLLMVGYMRRYDPGIEKARQLLAEVRASGELGRIVQVRLHIHKGGGSPHDYGSSEPITTAEVKPPVPTGPDDGLPAEVHQLSWSTNFFDTHLSDMLIHLLDPVREVLYADMEPETRSRMFIYDHGGYKSVHTGSDSVVGARDESMVVYFEKGRLTIRPSPNFRRDEHARVELLRGAGPSPVIERPLVAGPWCFRAQAEHFLRCVRTGERPRCTGEDALANAELLHAILAKLAGQGP